MLIVVASIFEKKYLEHLRRYNENIAFLNKKKKENNNNNQKRQRYLSRKVRKCTFGQVRPTKIQISLCIRAQSDQNFPWAHSG